MPSQTIPGKNETLFPEVFERETAWLREKCESCRRGWNKSYRCRLFSPGGCFWIPTVIFSGRFRPIWISILTAYLELARERLTAAGCNIPGVETSARYAWINRVLDGVVTEPSSYQHTYSDHIDRVLTHRVGGLIIFAAVMLVMFQAVFVWAHPAMDAIQAAIGALGGWVESQMAEGALEKPAGRRCYQRRGRNFGFYTANSDLVLFSSEYSKIADTWPERRFFMDRTMSRIGLSGKSFIPMLSSFACSVPGIMATRVIEDERDRLTTILVSPLLTCSARLPIYALLIAAFIPAQSYLNGLVNLQGLTLAGLYVLGIVMAVIVAMILKRTLLRGQSQSFVMELPSYKWPSLRTVAYARRLNAAGYFCVVPAR